MSKLLNSTQVVKVLGLSILPVTLRKWAKSRKVRSTLVGNRLYFDPDKLTEDLEPKKIGDDLL